MYICICTYICAYIYIYIYTCLYMLTGLAALNAQGPYLWVYAMLRTLKFAMQSGAMVLLIRLGLMVINVAHRVYTHTYIYIYIYIYIHAFVCNVRIYVWIHMFTHVPHAETTPSFSCWAASAGFSRPSGDGSLYTIYTHLYIFLCFHLALFCFCFQKEHIGGGSDDAPES